MVTITPELLAEWRKNAEHARDNRLILSDVNGAVVLALLDRIDALEGRASNREEVARRTFEAVWLDAKSAQDGWGGASPLQRVFWYKAAENIEAFILHGTSPTSGTHTEASSVMNAAIGGQDA